MSDGPPATRRRVTALNFFPAFVPPTSGGELRYYHVYKNLGRSDRIDLINTTHQAGDMALQRTMLRGPLGALLSRYTRWLESLACRESDVVFATSADDRRRLIELYRVAPDKVFVAPNGVDVSAVRATTDSERKDARR